MAVPSAALSRSSCSNSNSSNRPTLSSDSSSSSSNSRTYSPNGVSQLSSTIAIKRGWVPLGCYLGSPMGMSQVAHATLIVLLCSVSM